MNNFQLRPYLLLAFYIFFITPVCAQGSQIVVSDWVAKPSDSALTKPLLYVDFWATWCGPCISAMPHTGYLSDKYGDEVLFLYLSDEPSGKVAAFMKKRDLIFFSAVDNSGENIDKYQIHSLPRSILFGPDGRILWSGRPSEMSFDKMQRYVTQFRGKKGREDRIVSIGSKKKTKSWETYEKKGQIVKYQVAIDAPNDFTLSDSAAYFSGSLSYILAAVKHLPLSQIQVALEGEPHIKLLMEGMEEGEIEPLLESFYKDVLKVEIVKKKRKEMVILLDPKSTENYFNKNMYDFGKGDNAYLVDDMTLIIDNATIAQMATALSDLMPYLFVYNGENKEIYDWNIHYKFQEMTFSQLKDELNFDLTEEERKIETYVLKKAR